MHHKQYLVVRGTNKLTAPVKETDTADRTTDHCLGFHFVPNEPMHIASSRLPGYVAWSRAHRLRSTKSTKKNAIPHALATTPNTPRHAQHTPPTHL